MSENGMRNPGVVAQDDRTARLQASGVSRGESAGHDGVEPAPDEPAKSGYAGDEQMIVL